MSRPKKDRSLELFTMRISAEEVKQLKELSSRFPGTSPSALARYAVQTSIPKLMKAADALENMMQNDPPAPLPSAPNSESRRRNHNRQPVS